MSIRTPSPLGEGRGEGLRENPLMIDGWWRQLSLTGDLRGESAVNASHKLERGVASSSPPLNPLPRGGEHCQLNLLPRRAETLPNRRVQ